MALPPSFQSSAHSFERMTLNALSIDDLDVDLIEDYLNRRAPTLLSKLGFEDTATRLNILGQPKGSLHPPTVMGTLLFGLFPQLAAPHWGVSAIHVDGTSISDPLLHLADFEGPIHSLLEQMEAFILEHSTQTKNQLEPSSSQYSEFPPIAIKEALINSLIHRDWKISSRIAIRIFSDRLEIFNPGPPLIPLEEIMERGGISLPRNILLASTARTLGIGEQIGRGLPLIYKYTFEEVTHSLHIQTHKLGTTLIFPSRLRKPQDMNHYS